MPWRLTRPQVGLRPVNPQADDGMRIDPPVSEPSEPKHSPAAVATPDPLDDAPVATSARQGFTGVGRLVKTRNILRYLHDEPLRLRIQTQLNRGEARHGLARWLFFADQGEFRTSNLEMIMNKASCLSLLSNAVVLWNTLQIERIVTELRAGGTTIRDEDLVHVWPLQRRHITPNGVYFADRTMPAFVLPDPVEA
jgi:Tn3 transposase DDE domain